MMKAIQTRYAGYLFRSRLEARWAVFFDSLKLDWSYEPEGFQLPSGTFYLPDFRVMMHGHPVWFEIKPGDTESKPFEEFMSTAPTDWRGAVLNDIPDPRVVLSEHHYYTKDDRPYVYFGGGEDGDGAGFDTSYQFCICQDCGEVGFEFEARSERIGCKHLGANKHYTPAHPRIVAAFAAARSARFEHEAREVYAAT